MSPGSAVPGEQILLEQNKLILKATGANKVAVDVQVKMLEMVMAIVKKESDAKMVEKLAMEEFARLKEKASEEEKKQLEVRENGLAAKAKEAVTVERES